MKKNKHIILFTLIVSLLNVACKKETEYDVLTGQIIGYVSLSNKTLNNLSDDSGVEIIVEGSKPKITTTTDADGKFIIDDLKSGTYNLIFKKDGYTQHKIVSYQFLGGSTPATVGNIYLYTRSKLNINDLTITNLETPFSIDLRVTANIYDPDNNQYAYIRYYLSNEPDISYKNYISTGMRSVYPEYESLDFSLTIDTIKYPVGSELYMILYPASDFNQYYKDINSGKNIYTSVNEDKPSEIVNITIPEVKTSWW